MTGGIGYFLFFLLGFLALAILLVWPVFPYVMVAILLAYLFHPLSRRLQRAIPSPSVRAALMTLLAVITFAIPTVFILQNVTRELGSALRPEGAQRLLEHARVWLVSRRAEMLASWMLEMVEQGRQYLVTSIPSLFGSVFHISLGIFVCLFVFYYLTKEGAEIWHSFLGVLPLPSKLKGEMSREIVEIVQAVFYGQVLTALAQGALGGVGLVLFHVPQPALLTVLMTLLAFVPFVGTPLVWGPAGALKLMAGETWQGIGLLVYGAVLVTNIDNVIKPRLIAMHAQVHPVVILIGIIGGTEIFGFVGFLVGPVILAIFLRLLRFFGEYRAAESLSPTAPSS